MIADPVAIRNERAKLLAGFSNALGVGLIGFALLRPATENLAGVAASSLWWGLAGLAFHAFSHYLLSFIRKEAKE